MTLKKKPNPDSSDRLPIQPEKVKPSNDFCRRLSEVKLTRWIRFAVVCIVWLLFTIWMGNLWLLLAYPLLFDIYITGYIPLTWWKQSSNKGVRTLMGWVDAILYALILCYFLFAYVGQNYKIPSSSLEKTLLTGDYLWVNKMVYGPRVPQTPLHFPLAQHTLFGYKSYIDAWQLDYHRLPGFRNVERYDIVVFNAPMEDTVVTRRGQQDPDFYHMVYELENNPNYGIADGRAYVREHPEIFGEVIWRPVDRRENFVKRAVGLPGERLKIENDTVYINGKPLKEPALVQHTYLVPVSASISEEEWEELGVSIADFPALGPNPVTGGECYQVSLTGEMRNKLQKKTQVCGKIEPMSHFGEHMFGIFPLGANLGWTQENMGEFWIPKQGCTLHLTLDNLPVYQRAISTYEGNRLEVRGDKIYINGKPTEYYTFKLDYYWMMGDNRDNSADSRYWGFVPEDHIVGTPWRVLISLDGDKGWFSGKLRFERTLKKANPDK